MISYENTEPNNGKAIRHLIGNNGTKLNTIVYPKENAETVILLHGGPGVPEPMTEVVNLLQKKYQVIYFEQRGTGGSQCNDCSYSIENYISDIDAIADYYNLKSFHLFGHSWGGLYAQIYAEANASKIKSLFLCSPSSGTNSTWKETEKEVMQFNKKMASGGEWLSMGWNSLRGKMGKDKAYRKLFVQVYKNYHKGFIDVETDEEELSKIYARPINETRKEIIRYKPLQRLDKPSFPIYITYGEKDIYGKSKNKVIERYPTATISEIKNSGHIPWLHNSSDFENVLKQFYGI